MHYFFSKHLWPLCLVCGLVLCSLFSPTAMVNAHPDKTLNYAAYAFPISLDPAYGTTTGDLMLKVNLFEGLTTLDSTGEAVPGSAERWEVSEDGRQYTFYLREGLRWSDGSPVLAEHFANTVRRVHQGSGESRPTFHYELLENSEAVLQKKQGIEMLGLEVVDERTLIFRLTQPAPYFPDLLSYASPPSPSALKDRLTESDPLPPVASLSVNGAYKLADYQPHLQQYRLVKNPYYRGKDTVHFETVHYRLFDQVHQAMFDLATDKIAVYDRYMGSQQVGLQPPSAVQAIKVGSPSVDYITMNMQDAVLKDWRVRHALSLFLDRSALVEALGYTNTDDTVATTLSPPMPSIGWDMLPPVWGALGMEERRQQARVLLAEAGYGPSRRLKLEYLVNKGDENQRLAEQMRQQWREIGVDVKVIVNTTSTHYKTYLNKNNYQLARAGWSADYPDPLNFLNTLGSQNPYNYGRWQHQGYTQILQQLPTQALTPTERLALVRELETIIQQEVPVIPVYYKSAYALLSEQLAPVNQQGGKFLMLQHLRPKKW